MAKYYIDTNIFLRAIVNDNTIQSAKSQNFLKAIQRDKKNTYLISNFVILEIIFTLLSFYQYKKGIVIEILRSIVNTKNIKVENETYLLEALEIFENHNIDFVDCFSFVKAVNKKQVAGIYGFDKDFDKLPIKRIEPKATLS